MQVRHYEQVEQQPVDMPGARGCQVRWLVGEPQGAPTFAMRQFEIAPGGHTPKHSHPYEHEVFVLAGTGLVVEGDRQHAIQAGDVVFVEPHDIHQFQNTGTTPLKFLCLVPNSAKNQQGQVVPHCAAE